MTERMRIGFWMNRVRACAHSGTSVKLIRAEQEEVIENLKSADIKSRKQNSRLAQAMIAVSFLLWVPVSSLAASH
jgi:hypothetical protein